MKKKIIEEYNDRIALRYDLAEKGKFKETPTGKIIEKLLPLVKKEDLILDLGCGTGKSAKPFIRKGCKVIGVDISSKMLKIAKKKLKKKFWKLYKCDIEKGLNFKDNYFDVVLASWVLEFVKNIEKTVKEMARITKRNSYIAFTYELWKKDYKIQSKKESSLGKGLLKPIPKLLSFKVYRHTPKEIEKILIKNNLKKISHEKFISCSYSKPPEKIPVFYGMIISQKR